MGRNELLGWINELLNLSGKAEVKKVEQLAAGYHHCQVFNAMFPGVLPMKRVNYKARYDYEFLNNFKILQDGFSKVSIAKVIPVDRIVKARYQDNFEFLQWIHEFFVRVQGDKPVELELPKKEHKPAAGFGKSSIKRAASCSSPKFKSTRTPAATPMKKETQTDTAFMSPQTRNVREGIMRNTPSKAVHDRITKGVNERLAFEKVSTEEVAQLKVQLHDITMERDFILEKLKKLEVAFLEAEQGLQGTTLEIVQGIHEKLLFPTNC